MKHLLSLYTLKLPLYFVYMLQQVEYNPTKFWAWSNILFEQNKSIKQVMRRQKLDYTKRAKLLVIASYIFVFFVIFFAFFFGIGTSTLLRVSVMFLWIAIAPLALKLFLYIVSTVAFLVIVRPQQRKHFMEASAILSAHKGIKIAVLGSYGKTTMKELLNTVLSEGMQVASTPGNMNVVSSHVRFARSLRGDEQILLVEFGEGEPGDISRMASMLHPDFAVITGLAPNHLDSYPSLDAVAVDLLDIYKYVEDENVFVTGESDMLRPYITSKSQVYTVGKTLDWTTEAIVISINNLTFTLKNQNKIINVHSGLLGRHQIAPLSCVAVIADKLGLTNTEIEAGLANTVPHEHRMQSRLVHGAWLIDDTYNGNLEGLKAGLKFLSEVRANRKWYVTPGLVDQGAENVRVHVELGASIAEASPDVVVLMENSARPIIESSMKINNFNGELRIENNPLEFYTNIEHIVVAGDIVLMQNDWTDNYN